MIDVEGVHSCPVCGSAERESLHSALEDHLFGTPGRWTFYLCTTCTTAYLDPRPAGRGLQRAYAAYYTHDAPDTADPDRPPARVRRALKNAYLNATLGYELEPEAPLGRFWLAAFPLRRRAMRLALRDLVLPEGSERHLLDVGSGNGAFMLVAQQAGWRVEGIDPDRHAVRSAREAGLAVRHGRVEDATFETGSFDAITLHHVLEHVPDPGAVVAACREWLKPDGTLWLATPNLDAPGRHRYGRYWRGLDVPRHLVLFSATSLRRLLEANGFHVRFLPPAGSRWMYDASESLRTAATGRRTPSLLLTLRSFGLDLAGLRAPTRGEELVALARRSRD